MVHRVFCTDNSSESSYRQKGFSLIEVMVVVAIIAILTMMSFAQVQKLIAKARQTEARQNLSSLYVAEKNFFATYNTYFDGFLQIGFSPEGDVRYRIGFGQPGFLNIGDLQSKYGYSGNTASHIINTKQYCNTSKSCHELQPALEFSLSSTSKVSSESKFTAEAVSYLGFKKGGKLPDRWTIDEKKTVTNTKSGMD